MSNDNEIGLQTNTDLATIAEQRDDERQQAEAEAAQKMLQQMQTAESVEENLLRRSLPRTKNAVPMKKLKPNARRNGKQKNVPERNQNRRLGKTP